MARIRTIKPEFPQSESIGRISRDARLLFIQLWTVSDDSGRSRAASRMLASLLYPYDDDARELMDGWLDELEKENLIRRYEADGTHYLEIVNWLKHQKIDHPTASRIPEFRENSRGPRDPSRSLAPDLGPRTLDLGPRNGSGEEKKDNPTSVGLPSNDYAFEYGVIRLKKKDFESWVKAFQYLDVRAELIGLEPWASQQKNWFIAVSQALAKKNREAKARMDTAKTAGDFNWKSGMEGVV